MDVTLHLAQDPEADALLGRSPLAALTGMLLDQQVPMEWAFKGPATIARRLGADDLDTHEIAAYDPEAFAALLSDKPAVHRYPGSMAKRIQQLCQYLVEHYDGDAEGVWRGAATGQELLKRLTDLDVHDTALRPPGRHGHRPVVPLRPAPRPPSARHPVATAGHPLPVPPRPMPPALRSVVLRC